MTWFNGKRILVPFDFSDASIDAVRMALELAESPDEVHLLHVLLELPATDPAVVWDALDETKRIDHTREAMQNRLSDEGISGPKLDVGVGSPGQVVADLATEIEAGLIVIPSHGYTGIKRWFLGSVAETVVRLAKCPVLVLKG